MSALGQKQTFAVQKAMSALPPKADICSAPPHVRFGPIADIQTPRSQEGCTQQSSLGSHRQRGIAQTLWITLALSRQIQNAFS